MAERDISAGLNGEADDARALSKVEVTGFEARHYDALMNVLTAGTYPCFIRRVVRDMDIHPADAILILGSGTGRNACLMRRYLTEDGRIVGLEIGEEMRSQAVRRCRRHENVSFIDRRIEEPIPYAGEFDKVFMSFVMHGFVQEDRESIVENAVRALRPGWEFLILDYAEIAPESASWPVRLVLRAECPLATDFVRRDWQEILRSYGFTRFRSHFYYFGAVRLLAAKLGLPSD